MKKICILSMVYLFCGSSMAQVGGVVGLANPSAVLCADLGGQSEVLNAEEGQLAICVFGVSGIEEWTLFRQKNGAPQAVVEAYFNPKLVNTVIVNPRGKKLGDEKAMYCGLQGGFVKKTTNSSGYNVELCQFEDGSAMTKDTFYRGAAHHDNAELTALLK